MNFTFIGQSKLLYIKKAHIIDKKKQDCRCLLAKTSLLLKKNRQTTNPPILKHK